MGCLIEANSALDLFTAASIGKTTIKMMIKDIIPIVFCLLIVLALVTYVPYISLALPKLLQ